MEYFFLCTNSGTPFSVIAAWHIRRDCCSCCCEVGSAGVHARAAGERGQCQRKRRGAALFSLLFSILSHTSKQTRFLTHADTRMQKHACKNTHAQAYAGVITDTTTDTITDTSIATSAVRVTHLLPHSPRALPPTVYCLSSVWCVRVGCH